MTRRHSLESIKNQRRLDSACRRRLHIPGRITVEGWCLLFLAFLIAFALWQGEKAYNRAQDEQLAQEVYELRNGGN